MTIASTLLGQLRSDNDVKNEKGNSVFTAIKLKVTTLKGTKEYECSLHGGEPVKEDSAFRELLVRYSKGKLDLIKDVRKVQEFITQSGHGISNSLLIGVSDIYTVVDKDYS